MTAKQAPSKKPVFVSPVPVDLSFFSPGKTRITYDLVSVGRLVKQKNFSLLVNIVADLIEDFPELKLAIVGEGPEKQILENQIQALGLKNNIFLLGGKNRRETRDILRQSRIFVLSSNYEGWGMATVEASACGLPVAVSATGGAEEIVLPNESGFIVRIGDRKGFTDKISSLLKNPQLRKSMGTKGRVHVLKNFSQNRQSSNWITGLISAARSLQKICFVLPSYNQNTHTHYLYTYKLFEEVAKKYSSALFLEKPSLLPKNNRFSKVSMQSDLIKPLNLFERFYLLFKLRLNGYTHFFIHYSYWSLFILKIISIIFPAKIYYWHAESLNTKDVKNMGFFERWQLIAAVRSAPNLVTAGKRLAKDYADTFSVPLSKIKIVPNWVESINIHNSKVMVRKQLGIPKSAKVILFIHHLSPRKGAHLLPKIIKTTAAKLDGLYFLIIGDGPLKTSLQAKKYPAKTIFAGNIPHRKIKNYYSAADVFIMPSLREGFPRVILEAMSAGLPIVATDVGELKNIVPDLQKQYLAQANNLNSFVKYLIKLLTHNKLRERLATCNLKHVKQYSLKTSTDKLISILK